MKRNEIKVGGKYIKKVGGHITVIEVVAAKDVDSRSSWIRPSWEGRNLATGKRVWIKNPRSLRREATPAEVAAYSARPNGIRETLEESLGSRIPVIRPLDNPEDRDKLHKILESSPLAKGFDVNSLVGKVVTVRVPRPDDTYPPSKSDLLCLWMYWGILRNGWENGPSHEEMATTLLNHLCNIGLNPTTEEGKRVLREEGEKIGLKNLEELIKDRAINPDN